MISAAVHTSEDLITIRRSRGDLDKEIRTGNTLTLTFDESRDLRDKLDALIRVYDTPHIGRATDDGGQADGESHGG